MSDTPRSLGRKSIRPTLTPRDLMTDTPDLAGLWTAQVLTLLPEAFPGMLGESLIGRALRDELWQLQVTDLRTYGEGKHRNVDDTPAGGGAGMVLRADILDRALRDVRAGARGRMPLIYLTPRGRPMTQALMHKLAASDGVTLLCGRFEGVDERAIEAHDMIEVSLGDFVMTGGEIAAMALIDATVRLIPRVLGNQASVEEESFSHGLLEHPHYTKPADWNGRAIPEVLLSGHHAKITDWRRAQAERLTKERRPDLWRAYCAAHNRDPDEDQEL
ncbi:tRNA (guanosine(37)-N1)-methyltransferase TrmD [Salipiger sp. IMCC34102]|uniref:tRNA (guanosine(37)-N1)-methyltransferase TrmD n=1 Tax=Salipiger sp. IMCC34102 TaxID=2510647 RepID=UPI00101B6836|nr:tRNA (guanosine(37)-N1)-methyltransferase TrmD [Salipiger sp. IMCC34102]RYH03994.1 tRNA (guanosine(37)-N1)-methyltransferase TrmD [Salipiger sp. IMCC34102]